MSQGKSAYYSNEVVLDHEGKTLFRGSAKKINWYLDKGLAKVVNIGPPRTIQLLFKPNGPGVRSDDYSLSEKETKCVVCGCKNNLTRHHVVPSCYRSQMSPVYKDYNMHDVVLLCEECHINYERLATELKKQFANRYNAPLEGLKTTISHIVGYCKTILKNSEKLPPEKLKQMMDAIKAEFGNNDETTIREGAQIGTKAIVTHGELVVSKMQESEQEFVVLWRKHFIETMQPKFLPKGWDVKRKVYYNKDERK